MEEGMAELACVTIRRGIGKATYCFGSMTWVTFLYFFVERVIIKNQWGIQAQGEVVENVKRSE